MKEVAKAVVDAALRELEAHKETVSRMAKLAVETLERARKELDVLEEATKVGASQAFLGASVMLVGITQWPFDPPGGEALNLRLQDSRTGAIVELHGDPEALRNLRGRYKAIVLLYKAE